MYAIKRHNIIFLYDAVKPCLHNDAMTIRCHRNGIQKNKTRLPSLHNVLFWIVYSSHLTEPKALEAGNLDVLKTMSDDRLLATSYRYEDCNRSSKFLHEALAQQHARIQVVKIK